MSKVHLIGGGLGAGKTTFLEGIINNTRWSGPNGLIVMDAAGEVDFERLQTVCGNNNFDAYSANGACVVCDGPQQAIPKIKKMIQEGCSDIFVELSGRVALPIMQDRLAKGGVPVETSLYIVDPSLFDRVCAEEEIPYANTVGLSKTHGQCPPKILGRIVAQNPETKIITLDNPHEFNWHSMPRGECPNSQPFKRDHAHAPPGYSLASFYELNPYISAEELEERIRLVARQLEIDRMKGHKAEDAKTIIEFDCVFGDYNNRRIGNTTRDNGRLLIVQQGNNYFHVRELEESLGDAITPPTTPIVRVYSERSVFEEMIAIALDTHEYDRAMATATQWDYERQDDSLAHSVMPKFLDGKLNQMGKLTDSPQDRTTYALQAMSILYELNEYPPSLTPQHREAIRDMSRRFLDFDTDQHNQWLRYQSAAEENMKYLQLMRPVAEQYKA